MNPNIRGPNTCRESSGSAALIPPHLFACSPPITYATTRLSWRRLQNHTPSLPWTAARRCTRARTPRICARDQRDWNLPCCRACAARRPLACLVLVIWFRSVLLHILLLHLLSESGAFCVDSEPHEEASEFSRLHPPVELAASASLRSISKSMVSHSMPEIRGNTTAALSQECHL